jgi:uncharacterized protein YdcH (DUF465 family)
LGLIKERFSANTKGIEQLYARDAEFKSLCADYFLCDQTIKKINHEIEEMKSALGEYQEALDDLENEINSWIIKK